MSRESEITQCPFCFAEIDVQARKCCYCGEWVDERKSNTRSSGRGGQEKAPHEVMTEKFDEAVRNDSVAFAVIALVCIFVWPPIGFLLCLVGLFTGPRKGCFGSMLAFFLLFPLFLAVFGLITADIFTGGVFFSR